MRETEDIHHKLMWQGSQESQQKL